MKTNHPFNTNQKISLSAIIATALLVAGCSGMKPPTEQMAVSKVAVSNASSAGAGEFAPLELKSAMQKMNAAEKAMSDENYALALQLSEQAQFDAKLALMTARTAKAEKAAAALQEGNRVLRQEIQRKTQ